MTRILSSFPDLTINNTSTPNETPDIIQYSIILSLFGWESSTSSNDSTRKTSLTQSLSRGTTGSLARNSSVRLSTGARHSVDITNGGLPSISHVIPSNGHMPPSDDKDATLTCSLCQRRVGLWAFKSTPPSGDARVAVNGNGLHTPSDAASPLPSSTPNHPLPINALPRRRPTQARVLDVLKEHRSFCPYVVSSTPLPVFPAGFRPVTTSQVSATSTFNSGSNPALPQTTSKTSSPASTDETLVEGWRAVLSVVSRAGMGARRRRSDIFGPTHTPTVEEEGSGDGPESTDIDSMVESVKRGGVSTIP